SKPHPPVPRLATQPKAADGSPSKLLRVPPSREMRKRPLGPDAQPDCGSCKRPRSLRSHSARRLPPAPRFDDTTPTRRLGSPPGAARSACTSDGNADSRARCLGAMPDELSTTNNRSTSLRGSWSMVWLVYLRPDDGCSGAG